MGKSEGERMQNRDLACGAWLPGQTKAGVSRIWVAGEGRRAGQAPLGQFEWEGPQAEALVAQACGAGGKAVPEWVSWEAAFRIIAFSMGQTAQAALGQCSLAEGQATRYVGEKQRSCLATLMMFEPEEDALAACEVMASWARQSFGRALVAPQAADAAQARRARRKAREALEGPLSGITLEGLLAELGRDPEAVSGIAACGRFPKDARSGRWLRHEGEVADLAAYAQRLWGGPLPIQFTFEHTWELADWNVLAGLFKKETRQAQAEFSEPAGAGGLEGAMRALLAREEARALSWASAEPAKGEPARGKKAAL